MLHVRTSIAPVENSPLSVLEPPAPPPAVRFGRGEQAEDAGHGSVRVLARSVLPFGRAGALAHGHRADAPHARRPLAAMLREAFAHLPGAIERLPVVRWEFNTLLTQHVVAGSPTALADFAALRGRLAGMDDAAFDAHLSSLMPSTSGVLNTVRRGFGTLLEAAHLSRPLEARIEGVRAKTVGGAKFIDQATIDSSPVARALTSATPVATLWAAAPAGLRARLPEASPAFLAELDALAATAGPERALSAAFSFVLAQAAMPQGHAAPLAPDVLAYLRHMNPVAEIAAALDHAVLPGAWHASAIEGALSLAHAHLDAHRFVGENGIDAARLQVFRDLAQESLHDLAWVMSEPLAESTWPGMQVKRAQAHEAHRSAIAGLIERLDAAVGDRTLLSEHTAGEGVLTADALHTALLKELEDAIVAQFAAGPGVSGFVADLRAGPAEAGRSLAWATLHELADSADLPELFAGLTGRTLDGAIRDPLTRYLQAAKVVAAATGAAPTPEALADAQVQPQRNKASVALAQRVMEAAAEQLAAIDSGRPATLTGAQKADLLAWRNGFRDDGRGSDLAKAKARAHKVLTWIARLADDRSPMRPALHKSPLVGARHGLMGADLHLLADEQAKVLAALDHEALDAAIAALGDRLHAMLADRVTVLREAGDAQALAEDLVIHETLSHLCALDAWSPERKGARDIASVLHGRQFDPATPADTDREALARHTQAFAARHLPALDDAARAAVLERLNVGTANALARTRVGLRELPELARALGVDLSGAASEALTRARKIAGGESAVPSAVTADAVCEMLQTFARNVQFGNHIRFGQSQLGGISTRGLSENIGRIVSHLSAVPFVVRADLRYERGREAVVRVGAATHGFEIFIGTETRNRGHGGGGAFAGYSHAFKRVGGGADVIPYGYEQADYTGVMIRVARRVAVDEVPSTDARFSHDDKRVREKAAEIIGTLFSAARAQREGAAQVSHPDAFFESLANGVFDDEDVSIGWIDQRTKAHRSEVSGNVNGSGTNHAAHDGGRLGGTLAYAYEKVWRQNAVVDEDSGSYRVAAYRQAELSRHKVSASVSASAFLAQYGLASADAAGVTATLRESGQNAKVRVVRDRGKLVPRFCFTDREFLDVASYVGHIGATQDRWNTLFAYPHRGDPDGGLAAGRRSVGEHISKVIALRRPNHVYYTRDRLRPDVATLLDSLGDLHGKLARLDPESAQAVAAIETRAINDEQAWMPASLIAYEKSIRQRGPNVSVGLRYAQMASVEGEREIIFDTIGWAQLRKREMELMGLGDIAERSETAATRPAASVPPDSPRPFELPELLIVHKPQVGESPDEDAPSVETARHDSAQPSAPHVTLAELLAAERHEGAHRDAAASSPHRDETRHARGPRTSEPPPASTDDTRAHLENLHAQMQARTQAREAARRPRGTMAKLRRMFGRG